jgi:hypothetical protein
VTRLVNPLPGSLLEIIEKPAPAEGRRVRAIVTAFAKNPVFANFMTLGIIFAGTLAGFTLNRELFPSSRSIWSPCA